MAIGRRLVGWGASGLGRDEGGLLLLCLQLGLALRLALAALALPLLALNQALEPGRSPNRTRR